MGHLRELREDPAAETLGADRRLGDFVGAEGALAIGKIGLAREQPFEVGDAIRLHAASRTQPLERAYHFLMTAIAGAFSDPGNQDGIGQGNRRVDGEQRHRALVVGILAHQLHGPQKHIGAVAVVRAAVAGDGFHGRPEVEF
jgi:hypothetical protein